ncbi:MAG: DNA polymerase III subunit gamma/tau [Proteobacteria bacterium]|nr:DNA polymerase III subunit gamma/tau [Pseudomonadota bacterium]
MSYQVLARKWRPRSFETLVGQAHVVRALRHALTENRLHHAYLFTGTRGVGKTTIARILAKCFNCETGVTAEPCGRCGACTEIDAGRFVDLLEVDAATNTRVDEMRQLLDTAQYAPTRARYKVYVIDEVHMLSTSAFNAMLKTLEEPPEHLKFILATTDPQKIPVTVLSRCLQFNLKQMPAAEIAGHLAHLLTEEGVTHEAEALAPIARAAAGSMRDALSLLDQAIAHGAGSVDAVSVRSMLGTVDREFIVRLLEAVADGDAEAIISTADALHARSLSFDGVLADLASALLQVALCQVSPEAATEDRLEAAQARSLAERLDPETVQLLYQIALQGRTDLPLAPDMHAGFLMTMLRMLAFRPETEGAPKVAAPAVASVPARRPQGSARSAPKADTPAVKSGTRSAATADAGWPTLVGHLTVTGATRELARNAEMTGRDANGFDLLVPKSKAHLAERAFLDKLTAAVEAHLGRRMALRVTIGEASGESVAATESRAKDAQMAEAVDAMQRDGFVQDLVKMFDASVVDSSVRPTRDPG